MLLVPLLSSAQVDLSATTERTSESFDLGRGGGFSSSHIRPWAGGEAGACWDKTRAGVFV